MMRDELLRLVQFDPDQLRKAIRTCEQEADVLSRQREEVLAVASLYRQLLRTHGFEGVEAITSTIPAPTGNAHSISPDRRFRKMRIADAAVIVLSENGGRLHGKKIIKALEAGGLNPGGKYPMSTLSTAMRRDTRIEKEPRERNTWRLSRVSQQ